MTVLSIQPPHRRTPRIARLLGTALLLATSAGAFALEPFSANYSANFRGVQANGTMTLKSQAGNTWEYRLEVAGMGARIIQSTVFDTEDGQWRPLTSLDSQTAESGLVAMLLRPSSTEATYDWDARQAHWTGDVGEDRAGPVSLRAGDLDAMLLNLALVRDVQAGRSLEYRLVDEGRARAQTFTIEGTETVTVDGRSLEATKVMRDDGRRQLIAWVVDDLPVPARLLQRRNGRDEIDLRLQSFTPAS